jgi:SpoVK/Ycf46/Vps4 family AAA+-type ATPase
MTYLMHMKTMNERGEAESIHESVKDLVQLARLALTGRKQDVQLYIRRLIRRYRLSFPGLADELSSLLRDAPINQSPLRNESVNAIPVDIDTRLQLVRPEYPVQLDIEPVWTDSIRQRLEQIIFERTHEKNLYEAGLHPTRTALFTGPPGVGKTLAARWIAKKLDRPLIILELSAVMSSFLGRTGSNIRNIFDYAKGVNCVLLLDELDAVAKRRDDAVEIGELKRLVTVLLQGIDDWPPTGILLAATNHQELLDPAVWRRFEVVVEFPMPSHEQIQQAANIFLGPVDSEARDLVGAISYAFEGSSYNDIELALLRARRQAVISQEPLRLVLDEIIHERVKRIPQRKRAKLALALTKIGYSQHKAHDLTGVSRDTIRRASQTTVEE